MDDPGFSDFLLRAFLLLRSHLVELGAGLKIVGSHFSPDTRRLRQFAARSRLPMIGSTSRKIRSRSRSCASSISDRKRPVVIWKGTEICVSLERLARVLGIGDELDPEANYDLVVVGSGPGGLAAAVYGASEGLKTLIVESVATGGQAGMASRIENYLGFPAGLSGVELASRALVQADKFGASIAVPREAVALRRDGHAYAITLDDGEEIVGGSVILVLGARYRKLGVPGETELEGGNVYYARDRGRGTGLPGQDIAVVGGGTPPGRRRCSWRSARTRSTCWRGATTWVRTCLATSSTTLAISNIEVLIQTCVSELVGEDELTGVTSSADGRATRDRRHGPLHLYRRGRANSVVGGHTGPRREGPISTGLGQDRSGLARC